MKLVTLLGIFLFLFGCASAPVTPTSAPVPTRVNATLTPPVMPTAIDTFYQSPATYSRQLGGRTQTIRLGVSPDFATRPVLPFYGLSLADPKYADRLFEAVTYNHFFRWQEADWAARSSTKYDDFKARLEAGEELRYPSMDTRSGGAGAHTGQVNPLADLDIMLIPRHDGFITFPGSSADPGLSVKQTINPDGSLVVRAPLVYSQVIALKQGDPKLQELARTAIILALMEVGIPTKAIVNNDLKAINTWWETMPEQDLHRFQYSYLQKLLTDDAEKSILRLWDEKPTNP